MTHTPDVMAHLETFREGNNGRQQLFGVLATSGIPVQQVMVSIVSLICTASVHLACASMYSRTECSSMQLLADRTDHAGFASVCTDESPVQE